MDSRGPKEKCKTKRTSSTSKRKASCLRGYLRSALFSARDHTDQPSKYSTDDVLCWNGIQEPTPIKQIDLMEKQNPRLTVNVVRWDKGVYPHRLSKSKSSVTINFFLIGKGLKQHYTLGSKTSTAYSTIKANTIIVYSSANAVYTDTRDKTFSNNTNPTVKVSDIATFE